MKVLFLEAVQNFGGARKSTIELASGLQTNGVECLIVDFWGSCEAFVNEVKKKDLDIKFLDSRDTPVILSDSNRVKQIKKYFNYLFLWMKYRRKIKEIINQFKPDLIIVNNVKTLSILKKSPQYKIVFFARGWFLPMTMSRINKMFIRSKVDIFTGVSQATRHAIFAGNFTKLENIYVVQNSFDFRTVASVREKNKGLTPWYKENENREFKILHCGGFLESKGQLLLIDIAKELICKNIKFKFIIVGIVYEGQASEKFFEKFSTLVKQSGLSEKFDFILNKPNALKYFDQCDILVHPTYTEGLPRVAMESMAFGKPVVGNAVGGMTDYIINQFSGYLTNFNHVEEYVTSIIELYQDKAKYKYMSENSIEIIEKSFNSQNQIKDFMKIFNN